MTTNCKRCGALIEFDGGAFPSLLALGIKPSHCEDCAVVVNQAQADREAAAARECTEQAMIKASGIHESMQVYDPALGNMPLLRWISDNREQWLWIAGANRIGKTRAAAYAGYRTIRDRLQSVIFANVPVETVRLMALRKSGSVEAMQRLERLWSCSLLILDDLGKERMTEAKAEVIWSIVDVRHSAGKRTWITTNYGGEELAERIGPTYGPGIVARLKEVCRTWKPEMQM